MTNLKKVFLVILVGAILLSVSSMVAATDNFVVIQDGNTAGGVQEIPTNQTNTAVPDNTNTNGVTTIVQNPAGSLNTTVVNNTTPTNNNTSTYNNTSNLPKTGVGDYTVVTAIVLLAIIAIYAYKKVKDYKGI